MAIFGIYVRFLGCIIFRWCNVWRNDSGAKPGEIDVGHVAAISDPVPPGTKDASHMRCPTKRRDDDQYPSLLYINSICIVWIYVISHTVHIDLDGCKSHPFFHLFPHSLTKGVISMIGGYLSSHSNFVCWKLLPLAIPATIWEPFTEAFLLYCHSNSPTTNFGCKENSRHFAGRCPSSAQMASSIYK